MLSFGLPLLPGAREERFKGRKWRRKFSGGGGSGEGRGREKTCRSLPLPSPNH